MAKDQSLRILLYFFLCLCFLFNLPIAQAQADPANEVIQLVNQLRASYGVPAYQVDSILMSVAQAQASWSAANNHIGHDGPDGSSPNDRAQAAGYGDGSKSFAIENAAHGTASYNTPQLVVTMWQGDWGHLNAMISTEYEHIGVGFAEAGGYSWYVMMVGWVDDGSPSDYTGPQEAPEDSQPYVPFILSEPDEDGAIYHEIQPGQTAWTVAANYQIELVELLALNNLTENSILQVGDILLVRQPDSPTSTPPPTPTNPPLETPTKPLISTVTPTSTLLSDPQPKEQSKLIPSLVVTGLGVILLVGAALVLAVSSRRRN